MTTLAGTSISANTDSFGNLCPSGPCIVNDQRPPDLNSQILKEFVNPAGPHHRASLSGSLNAAKTCSGVEAISREVWNGFISSARYASHPPCSCAQRLYSRV